MFAVRCNSCQTGNSHTHWHYYVCPFILSYLYTRLRKNKVVYISDVSILHARAHKLPARHVLRYT